MKIDINTLGPKALRGIINDEESTDLGIRQMAIDALKANHPGAYRVFAEEIRLALLPNDKFAKEIEASLIHGCDGPITRFTVVVRAIEVGRRFHWTGPSIIGEILEDVMLDRGWLVDGPPPEIPGS